MTKDPLDRLSWACIQKMTVVEASNAFKFRSVAQRRMFSECGKLHYHISQNLAEGQTVFGELRRRGVRDSDIKNAAYASKVFGALVIEKHIPEKSFEELSFSECVLITKVMSDRSKKRLEPAEVAKILHDSPDPGEELETYATHGMSTAEKAKIDAKAQAESQARAKIDAKATSDKAQATAPKAISNADPPAESDEPDSSETPEAAAPTESISRPVTEPTAPRPAPEPEAPPPAEDAMARVLRLAGDIEDAALEIDDPADRKTAYARLTEMMDSIATVWAATATEPEPEPEPAPAHEPRTKRRRHAAVATA